MKRVVYILSLIFTLISGLEAVGQAVPWVVTPTTNTQTVIVKNFLTIRYDGAPSPIGDAVGLFFDQSGTWKCGGYIQLDGSTNSFTIYGDTGGDNGFQNFENYHLKYWHKSSNCEIDNPFGAVKHGQFNFAPIDTLISTIATPAIVNYPKDYYCQNNSTILPVPLTITGTTFANLSISISPAGFGGYNPLTGDIENFSVITPGSYTFTVNTLDNKCLRSNSFIQTVSNKLTSTPIVKVIQPDCIDKSGLIKLDTASILKGTKPYVTSLKNISTGSITNSPSGIFNNLLIANYQLIIQDQNLCADTIPIAINAYPLNCDEVSDILNPTGNVPYSEVFLPWTGNTKIYNSQGQLINSFTTPAVWDGKDQSGQFVGIGAYFIFTDGEKKKEITVVY